MSFKEKFNFHVQLVYWQKALLFGSGALHGIMCITCCKSAVCCSMYSFAFFLIMLLQYNNHCWSQI